MCGRYVTPDQAAIERAYAYIKPLWQDYHASYNVAPTQRVPVVRFIDGEAQGSLLKWGLIPFFAKGETPKYSTINATIEKLESGPVWRGPWKHAQRCILLARGFYEWQVREDGSKQPYYIHVADQDVFGFAGLWDRSEKADGTVIESCTIITMPASPLMATIHNVKKRMPAILPAEDHEIWLSGTADQARVALIQYPDELLAAWPVSTRANTPKNNDQNLINRM